MQAKVKEMDVNRLHAEVINERRLDSIGSGTGERVREAEFAYETGVCNSNSYERSSTTNAACATHR